MVRLTNPEIELFAVLGNTKLPEYLKAQRELAQKTLSMAESNAAIFREQGKVQLLDALIENLATAGTTLQVLRQKGVMR